MFGVKSELDLWSQHLAQWSGLLGVCKGNWMRIEPGPGKFTLENEINSVMQIEPVVGKLTLSSQ